MAVPARRQRLRARMASLPVMSSLLALALAAPVLAGGPGGVTGDLLHGLASAVDGGHASDTPSRSTAPQVYRRTGVDVSHYQGHIDWPTLARTDIDFVIIKATDGNHLVDPWYTRNRARAHKVGLLMTAYHFARPGLRGQGTREQRIRRDARREAHFFVRTAGLRGTDLIPALDLEDTGGLAARELRIWTLAFLCTVRDSIGASPMVYSTASFWQDHLSDTAKVARAGFHVLWVAHWGAQQPAVPGQGWLGRGWTFWQWTACGRIAGIDECVDRNTYLSRRPLHSLTIARQRSR